MNKLRQLLLSTLTVMTLVACGTDMEEQVEDTAILEDNVALVEEVSSEEAVDDTEEVAEQVSEEPAPEDVTNTGIDTSNHRVIEVAGGNTSGHREANVAVNIGHGNREYWAYTNEHGQLVKVTAKEIIVQDDATEDVNSDGRYYSRMADVPGVGQDYGMDRGHVIADSLGGVANAYNITPQEATLNRHGDQAYMENEIRRAGGATDFVAVITYPDTKTQTPSHYEYTYTIKGNTVTDSFANTNPDKVNADLGLTSKPEETKSEPAPAVSSDGETYVDENGNGLIKGSNSGIYHTPSSSYYDRTTSPKEMFKTVQEAENAGYRAPKN